MTQGAMTTRRIYREYGPRPTWEFLVHEKYLKVAHTPYGPVVAATKKGHKWAEEKWQCRMPYVDAASHMANRAYLMDALEIIRSQGYTLHHHVYKPAGKVGSAARSGRPVTDQITRTVVSVPEPELRRLKAIFGVDDRRNPLQQDRLGRWSEAVGHPSLYATISNGGISLNGVKALLREHKEHLKVWHTPLIIVTPNEALLRPLVRSINGRYRHQQETLNAKVNRPGLPPPNLPIHELVTLIDLPCPQNQKPA